MAEPEHLAGCRERIKRAEAHLKCLYAERDAWEGGYHEFVIKHEPDTGWHIFRTTYFQSPPLVLGVIASDYIHQLRSTLDNLVCSLAELNRTACTADHRFPITMDSSHWKGDRNGMLKGLRTDHINEIKSVQPYEYATRYDPKDHPFAVLDELSRFDKHRLLTPTPLAFADSTPNLVVRKPGVSLKEVKFEAGTPLETDREFLRAKVEPDDPDPDFNLKGGLAVYISFGQRPINERSLKRIGDCVVELTSRSVFEK